MSSSSYLLWFLIAGVAFLVQGKVALAAAFFALYLVFRAAED